MEESNNLVPCPRCGGRARQEIGYDVEFAICTQCGLSSKTYVGDYHEEGNMSGIIATELWNTGNFAE